ncbi:MAG TPA: methyltransferase domain-containing protein [Segeticoccus sp.]|uniref:class I SAM-dependent methyltransferase n=1 Tax=Segeticoccus sp. TaxID=2706531 RepID=UPI002D800518|nr:methyltransferase domain-containing protein [Segeticoccus sp.]HET8600133.1 methyltransferase domain-containing protein [Segeticoccus sp.]
MSRRAVKVLLAVAGTALALTAGVLLDEAPYPVRQRWLLDIPLPGLGNRAVDKVLRARPGERMLEIGPGSGLQALHVAARLGQDGRLEAMDVQQGMLDVVGRRARRRRLTNLRVVRGDAHQLPFEDNQFDAVYMVTVLGEIPHPAGVLTEVKRVLRPGGRLVVGEFADRHYVRLRRLTRLANGAGLQLTTVRGLPGDYRACFVA